MKRVGCVFLAPKTRPAFNSIIRGNKCQLDATHGFFIVDLIACSTCFGHHYGHHQEIKSITQVVAACGIWCFGFQVVGLV
jgi:hypothetical protein